MTLCSTQHWTAQYSVTLCSTQHWTTQCSVTLCSRGVTVHVFVPNRHGTGTSVRLQRWTAVHKCGVHSLNMVNVKACFAIRNLKLEVGVPPGLFSQSILLRNPLSSSPSGCRMRNAIGRPIYLIQYVCYKLFKQCCKYTSKAFQILFGVLLVLVQSKQCTK